MLIIKAHCVSFIYWWIHMRVCLCRYLSPEFENNVRITMFDLTKHVLCPNWTFTSYKKMKFWMKHIKMLWHLWQYDVLYQLWDWLSILYDEYTRKSHLEFRKNINHSFALRHPHWMMMPHTLTLLVHFDRIALFTPCVVEKWQYHCCKAIF